MEHAGKLFNHIPLLKKLKWREFIGVKCLWGTLTDKNNPLLPQNANDPTLMMFPVIMMLRGISFIQLRDGSQEALCRDQCRYS